MSRTTLETAPTIVSVNLLPRELIERARARRITQYTIGGVLLFVAVLGGAYFLRLSAVWRAEDAREEASTEVARLETELDQLDEYRKLVDQMENRSTLLATAMGNEIAFSTVLNNLSLVFPANASLTSLTFTTADAVPPAEGQISFGEAVAGGQFSGYSIERYAPGVETVLLDLDRTPAFFNAFVTTAGKEKLAETEVTNFAGKVSLDSDAYTGRYAEGLPPEVTP